MTAGGRMIANRRSPSQQIFVPGARIAQNLFLCYDPLMNKDELLKELEKSRPGISKYVNRRMRWRWPLYQLQRRIERFFT
ncbi:hypothetical protein NBRC116589_43740 [Ruegeria sp. HU-ET01832]|uniref:hypothetical protein n=1 Tax=Ruegeria sp. HU-ET01832 TaxID=3135906 RepID=UPI0031054363